MEQDTEQEGMSTGKKVVAGAAVGLAVPAAVGVAKKLLSDGDDGDASEQQEGTGQQRRGRTSSSTRSRRPGSRGKTPSSSSRSRSKAASSKSRSSSGRASSSSSSRRRTSSGRGSSSQSGRTKEQLYNQAKRLNIEGRSSMTKAQLERAIGRKRS